MNRFVPLLYVWDTLTVWHVAIWLAVPIVVGVVLPLRDGRPIMWAGLAGALPMLAIAYAVLAIATGQLFGDKFTLAALWRSTALLGGAWIGLVLAVSQWRPPWPVSLFFVAAGAGFVTFALWFLPRAAGLGFIDFPEAAWGVHLYQAP
ncbi:hypothetical protein [Erythrobacter oryzae]|uniref:hypothetical protein n=1 Tax=Erythrobacter oryzae TaxID=3019556 RepID=UPI0025522825|nr:hypothetical protein [Erythrobacter sp. COR-2]